VTPPPGTEPPGTEPSDPSDSGGSIEFISATPTNIRLKGLGNETSTVVFRIVDVLGNPLPDQLITFSLNTDVGELTLAPTSATSNSNGEVQTTVQAGTVATPVRVTATLASNPSIKTQSELLVVSTGIPDQNSFSLSIETFNPEAYNYDGVKVAVTVHAADRFNNPVPDGTAIYFTTEGGAIEPSCTTTAGTCSVMWTSQAPRPADGRVTVTAIAIGEESFLDTNGNGVFDDADTFDDMPEAFQDFNENTVRDDDEPIFDFNKNETYDFEDNAYNGLLCAHSSRCSETTTLNVRDNGVIVMATSDAKIEIVPDPIVVPRDGVISITVRVQDEKGNMMPADTSIAISVDSGIGTLSGQTSYIVPNTSEKGPLELTVTLKAGNQAATGKLTVEVTTPRGIFTEESANVTVK